MAGTHDVKPRAYALVDEARNGDDRELLPFVRREPKSQRDMPRLLRSSRLKSVESGLPRNFGALQDDRRSWKVSRLPCQIVARSSVTAVHVLTCRAVRRSPNMRVFAAQDGIGLTGCTLATLVLRTRTESAWGHGHTSPPGCTAGADHSVPADRGTDHTTPTLFPARRSLAVMR